MNCKNNDSFKGIRNNMIVDRVIDNVHLAIKTNEKHLFGFSRKYDGDLSNMLHSVIYDPNILRFFKLLLAEFPRTRKETLKLPDKEMLDQFVYCLLSDIKMSLLKDAVINLSSYFVGNINDKKSLEIKYELFYTEEKFRSELKGFKDKTELADLDKKISKLESHEHILHCKFPIITFPWYAYALNYNDSEFPKFESGKEFNIVNGQCLSLDWLGRNNSPSSFDYIENQQTKMRAFLNSLGVSNKSSTNPQYNRSLNLYLFDEITDLYFIFSRLNTFRKQSMYFYISKKGREGLNPKSGENKKRFYRLENQFYGYGEFAKIKGLGNKLFLSANLNEDLINNDRIYKTYNEVFTQFKNFILRVIEKEHLSKYHNFTENIRMNYCIYQLFKKEEPYLDLLDQSLFEVLEDEGGNVDGHLDKTSDHVPPEEIDFLMNAAYFYLHKFCYEAQYKGQKLGNFEKY